MAALLPDPPPFQYTLPPEPVAGTSVDIGNVTVTIGLLLTGDLFVGPVGISREAALAALGEVAKGVMIRGLGSATPRVSAAAGHRFTQRHHDFRAPNTVISTGECIVDFTRRQVTVSGELGYALEVTAERPPSARAPQGWFRRHEKELASIGLLLLVAVPIAPARLTPRPA
jgi:hypothetical protein